MPASNNTNLSSADFAPINNLSGKGAVLAQDNAIVVGSKANVGNTTLNAAKGGTITVNSGGEQIAALSSQFASDLRGLTSTALQGSSEQVNSLSQSLRDTFDKAVASIKELGTRQQDAGLSDGMKFALGLGALFVVGLFVFRKK